MWQAEACREVSEQSIHVVVEVEGLLTERISVVITLLAVHAKADWDTYAEKRSYFNLC
jgi:hypothetical protein